MALLFLTGIGCTKSRWADIPDAPADVAGKARELWQQYSHALAEKDSGSRPVKLARFFSNSLLGSTEPKEFESRIQRALMLLKNGAFAGAEPLSVKTVPEGLLLVLDTKGGEAAIPLVEEGGAVRFSELQASCGEWAGEPKFGPTKKPDRPSLLYIRRIIEGGDSTISEKLRATLEFARPEMRRALLEQMRREQDAIVRLGLGLARVKLDGWDESFLRNFPTSPEGLAALQAADGDIFEEMMVKLTNQAAQVEDPPANEVLFKAATAAPEQLKRRFAAALYDMGEAGPIRLANAVRNLAGENMAQHPAVKLYLEELERRGGKAPKLQAFLRKFASIGEAEERKLCRALLDLITRR